MFEKSAGGESPSPLPCPFCGHEPRVDSLCMIAEVRCVNPECHVKAYIWDDPATRAGVIAKWNRRESVLRESRSLDSEKRDAAQLVVTIPADPTHPDSPRQLPALMMYRGVEIVRVNDDGSIWTNDHAHEDVIREQLRATLADYARFAQRISREARALSPAPADTDTSALAHRKRWEEAEAALAVYEREMRENIIPEVVEAIQRRARLASEQRGLLFAFSSPTPPTTQEKA